MALKQNFGQLKTSHKEKAMQAVDVQQIVPQSGTENAEIPQAPAQEQVTNEDEFGSKGYQIRNITAFGDCV